MSIEIDGLPLMMMKMMMISLSGWPQDMLGEGLCVPPDEDDARDSLQILCLQPSAGTSCALSDDDDTLHGRWIEGYCLHTPLSRLPCSVESGVSRHPEPPPHPVSVVVVLHLLLDVDASFQYDMIDARISIGLIKTPVPTCLKQKEKSVGDWTLLGFV